MVTKDDFLKYYAVQKYGAYNMRDPQAIELTGLDEVTYAEIIGNYSKFRDLYLPKRNPSFVNNGTEPISDINKQF